MKALQWTKILPDPTAPPTKLMTFRLTLRGFIYEASDSFSFCLILSSIYHGLSIFWDSLTAVVGVFYFLLCYGFNFLQMSLPIVGLWGFTFAEHESSSISISLPPPLFRFFLFLSFPLVLTSTVVAPLTLRPLAVLPAWWRSPPPWCQSRSPSWRVTYKDWHSTPAQLWPDPEPPGTPVTPCPGPGPHQLKDKDTQKETNSSD